METPVATQKLPQDLRHPGTLATFIPICHILQRWIFPWTKIIN